MSEITFFSKDVIKLSTYLWNVPSERSIDSIFLLYILFSFLINDNKLSVISPEIYNFLSGFPYNLFRILSSSLLISSVKVTLTVKQLSINSLILSSIVSEALSPLRCLFCIINNISDTFSLFSIFRAFSIYINDSFILLSFI